MVNAIRSEGFILARFVILTPELRPVVSLRVALPSRRLSGGRPRPPRRGRDALGTAGKMPALLLFQRRKHHAVTLLMALSVWLLRSLTSAPDPRGLLPAQLHIFPASASGRSPVRASIIRLHKTLLSSAHAKKDPESRA